MKKEGKWDKALATYQQALALTNGYLRQRFVQGRHKTCESPEGRSEIRAHRPPGERIGGALPHSKEDASKIRRMDFPTMILAFVDFRKRAAYRARRFCDGFDPAAHRLSQPVQKGSGCGAGTHGQASSRIGISALQSLPTADRTQAWEGAGCQVNRTGSLLNLPNSTSITCA